MIYKYIQKMQFESLPTIDGKSSWSGYICIIKGCFDSLLAQSHFFLHEVEKDKLEKMTYKNVQLNFLLGRYAAKLALTSYNKEKYPKKYVIHNGVFGHPYIDENVHISIAHTGNVGVSSVSSPAFPIGVDIELLCSPIELSLFYDEIELAEHCGIEKQVGGILLWTAKEAISKILKTGLTLPLYFFKIISLKKVHYNQYILQFENFIQYHVISTIFQEFVLSVAYPGEYTISTDRKQKSRDFQEGNNCHFDMKQLTTNNNFTYKNIEATQ